MMKIFSLLMSNLSLFGWLIFIPVFSITNHQQPHFGIRCVMLLCFLFPLFLIEFCGWHLVQDFRKLNRMGRYYKPERNILVHPNGMKIFVTDELFEDYKAMGLINND